MGLNTYSQHLSRMTDCVNRYVDQFSRLNRKDFFDCQTADTICPFVADCPRLDARDAASTAPPYRPWPSARPGLKMTIHGLQ